MSFSSLGYGGSTGIISAAAGAVGGDHSLILAIIAAIGGVAAAVIGPFVSEYIRMHRKNLRRQKELSEVLLDDLAKEREENRKLRDKLHLDGEDGLQ